MSMLSQGHLTDREGNPNSRTLPKITGMFRCPLSRGHLIISVYVLI